MCKDERKLTFNLWVNMVSLQVSTACWYLSNETRTQGLCQSLKDLRNLWHKSFACDQFLLLFRAERIITDVFNSLMTQLQTLPNDVNNQL